MKSLEILKEKKIKFTPAQKKIVERLLSGDQIIVVMKLHCNKSKSFHTCLPNVV